MIKKTVISAFEYKKFRKNNPKARLLFIVHREEILKKSRDTIRDRCRDLNFKGYLIKKEPEVDMRYLNLKVLCFRYRNC